MSLLSFIALALGIAATAADGVPRPNVALIAVSRGSRRASARRVEERPAMRIPAPAARHARVRQDHRSLRRLIAPLRGAAAARAPGACC